MCAYFCLPFAIRYPVLVRQKSIKIGPRRLLIWLPYAVDYVKPLLEVFKVFAELFIPLEKRSRMFIFLSL